jgi:hypothetical protein
VHARFSIPPKAGILAGRVVVEPRTVSGETTISYKYIFVGL